MSTRCYLFVCLNGMVSFWEYTEGTLCPCLLHSERKFPKDNFWETWKTEYRLGDSERRDLLLLSDHPLSECDVPTWFGVHGVAASVWTHERLVSVVSELDDFVHKTVVVELCSRQSTVWHGGDPASPLVLYGISASELCLPEDKVEDVDDSKSEMRIFLSGAEERRAQNELRCKGKGNRTED